MLITVNKAENVVERIGGPPPIRNVRKFFVVLANFAATAAAWLSGCFGKFLEVILCHKNGLKRALAKNYQLWGPKPREGKQMSFLWAASTANVTNASFKSSTVPVPLQTTLLAWEPSERKSKERAEVLSQCCGSGMIYSGSGTSFEISEFRIQAKVSDPCWSGSNSYYWSTLYLEIK